MTEFIPTSATTWCDIASGNIDNTIDAQNDTYIEFADKNQTCLTQWEWDNRFVNNFYILSSEYTLKRDCHIYGIWLKIGESYVKVWEGELYLPDNDWLQIIIASSCSGLRIAQSHTYLGLESPHPRIYKVYGEEPDAAGCTNPDGNEGQIVECGAGYGGQPDITHKYKCIGGVWVDQGYNPDCDISGCTNPFGIEGEEICGDVTYGQDPTHKYKCISGIWTDLGYSSDCDISGCTNPFGIKGVIICGDSSYDQDPTHKYRCWDGTWYDLGEYPECGGGERNYLPYIIAGVGVGILLIGLAKR